MSLPGFKLHPLKGNLAGYWSVTISANWRIIFRFEEGDATDIDPIDYHWETPTKDEMKNPPHPGLAGQA